MYCQLGYLSGNIVQKIYNKLLKLEKNNEPSVGAFIYCLYSDKADNLSVKLESQIHSYEETGTDCFEAFARLMRRIQGSITT